MRQPKVHKTLFRVIVGFFLLLATLFLLQTSCKRHYLLNGEHLQNKLWIDTCDVFNGDAGLSGSEKSFDNLIRQPNDTWPADLTPYMTLMQTDAVFYSFISNLHYICKDRIRLGNFGDGGWNICVAGPYRPKASCLVYSFGVNYDFSFEDAAENQYGCIVRSFDPSMDKIGDHVRGRDVHFFKIGLAGSDRIESNGWKMRTLATIVRQLNDTGKDIDILKFDIEGSEWEVIQSILNDSAASDLISSRVKQVAFEIHLSNAKPPAHPRIDVFFDRWLILSQFERHLGFRRWSFSMNEYMAYDFRPGIRRSTCYEMAYINRRFLLQT